MKKRSADMTTGYYLLPGTREMIISQGAISFMGGKPMLILSRSDIHLFFRPDNSRTGKPFDQLKIKDGLYRMKE